MSYYVRIALDHYVHRCSIMHAQGAMIGFRFQYFCYYKILREVGNWCSSTVSKRGSFCGDTAAAGKAPSCLPRVCYANT